MCFPRVIPAHSNRPVSICLCRVLNRKLQGSVIYYAYRCFGLGLGPRACKRLLQGVAKLTGGTTEYLDDEERLQPKVG